MTRARIAIELMVPVTLAGMTLPAGISVSLSTDRAMQLLNDGRARLASDTATHLDRPTAGDTMPRARIAIELLVPVTLAGMTLPAGISVSLSTDRAMQLLNDGRARLASDTPRPIYRR